MPGCAIKSCNSRSATSSLQKDGITFHLFPKSGKKRETWIRLCGQKDAWCPTKTSTICSRHFTNDCFDVSAKHRRRLFDFAVPTLLIHGESPVPVKNPSPVELPPPAPSSFINCTCPNAQVVGVRLRKLEIVAKHQKKKIKHLQYRTRTLDRRAETLELKLKLLKEHFAMSEEDFENITRKANEDIKEEGDSDDREREGEENIKEEENEDPLFYETLDKANN